MSPGNSPVLRRLFWFTIVAVLVCIYMILVYKPLVNTAHIHPFKLLNKVNLVMDSYIDIGVHDLEVNHKQQQQAKQKQRREKRNKTVVVESEWLEYKVGSDYGDGTCGKRHSIARLRGILQYWHDTATANNITYFLTYGSLIGATRDGQVVHWDTDLDVYIDMRDNVKLDAIKSKRNFNTRSENYHLALDVDWRVFPVTSRRRVTCDGRMNTRDSCTFNGPIGRVIRGYEKYLDIWDLEIINGMAFDRYGHGYYYPIADIYPLKKCKLAGITTFCPKNPKVIFDAFYGKDAKMAPGWRCNQGKWIRHT